MPPLISSPGIEAAVNWLPKNRIVISVLLMDNEISHPKILNLTKMYNVLLDIFGITLLNSSTVWKIGSQFSVKRKENFHLRH